MPNLLEESIKFHRQLKLKDEKVKLAQSVREGLEEAKLLEKDLWMWPRAPLQDYGKAQRTP